MGKGTVRDREGFSMNFLLKNGGEKKEEKRLSRNRQERKKKEGECAAVK